MYKILEYKEIFMYWNTIYREKLVKEYKKIFDNNKKPKWAVKKINDSSKIIHPAIPFVGKNYDKTKLIVYASAENLSFYKEEGYLDDDEKAIYRRYDSIISDKKKGRYFPNFHCGPIDCGQLLIVSAYILKYLNINLNYNDPYEFVTNISADNFGKFSEAGEKNRDYAGNIERLKYSLKYIEADLKILQPKIIILLKRIYEFKEIHKLIQDYLPKCLCIPIYQMFPQNINLKNRISKFPKRKQINIDPILLKWHEKITDYNNKISGQTKKNFYSIYNYIDSVIKEYKK
jgi:hypothetical protein